ncbi:MAG: radical SAM protein [Streptococcaceae bacterium]|jgi:radical SAM protein with 4Fe4S-binding SPASM domain|nr:radical SAM protein [Streptococcaceae bacterium]
MKYNLNSLLLYLTWRCNLRCIHCWIEAGNEFSEHINFEDIHVFLNQAVKMGLKHIRFTGGEPILCWKTIKNVIEYTKKDNLFYDMETNGSLLNKEKIAFLKENKVVVSISINGINEEEHDSFSVCPGAFKKTIANFKYMQKIDYPPQEIITCINKKNLKNLPERISFFDNLKVKAVKINIIQNSGRAEKMHVENKLLSVEDIIKIHKVVKELQKKTKLSIFLDVPDCMKCSVEFSHGLNKCGINHMLCILPNLDIALCGYGTFDKSIVLDKINEGFDLENCWKNNSKLKKLRNAYKNKLSGVCKKCLHFVSCQGSCRIKAFREYGNWDAPFPDCQYMYENNLFPKTRLLKI